MKANKLLLLCFVLGCVQLGFSQTKSEQIQFKWPTLFKETPVAETVTPSITIRLDHLQAEDMVNILPKGRGRIACTAATFTPGNPEGQTFLDKVKPGTTPSSNSLSVDQSNVNFVRPTSKKSLEDTAILNIQVPEQAKISVLLDGNLVLNSAVERPLSIRNGTVSNGFSNTMETLFAAARPSTPFKQLLPDQIAVLDSKLQVLKRVPLRGTPGTVIVELEINEVGRVFKVRKISGPTVENLVETLHQWEFAPFIVNGKAVPVITITKIVIE